MSDSYLILIPTESRLIPAEEAAQAAVALLFPALPEAHEIVAESHGFPVFVDQGANLEFINCPSCGSRLPFNPASEAELVRDWWYAIVDPLEGQCVDGVIVTMYCCGARVPFSSLTFDWPAGIASFQIDILNPGIGESLPPSLV
jgi:hypothetical protein